MTGFRNYRSGEAATVPTNGRPFQLACTECAMVHSLVHTVDDDGNVRMRVYVDPDETERLRAEDTGHRSHSHSFADADPRKRTTVSPIRHRFDDQSAYDEHGILRDGHAVTVPLMMRDAQRGVPMIIDTGLRLDREFYPDGEPKKRRNGVRRDRFGRLESEFEEEDTVTVRDAYAGHKPGFRTNDSAGAGRAVIDAAYREMQDDLTTQWMSREQKAQHVADARRMTVDAGRPAGISDSEWQRELGIRELSNAWRPRDSDTTANGKEKD